MDMDFSLILLILVIVTGGMWLLDHLLLAPTRQSRLKQALQSAGIGEQEYQDWLEGRSEEMPESRKRQMHEAWKVSRESTPVEYARSFFPVLLVVLVIRSFLFEPFQIPTGSMIPTLKVGDFIVVNKFSYGVRLPVTGTKIMDVGEPERGDVMVFIPPHDPTYYIKRVVGMPGDHIRYEDKVLYINGEEVEQEFVASLRENGTNVNYLREELGDVEHDIHTATTPTYLRSGFWLEPQGRTVPEGHYFMMGDNRDNSDDSRRWGPVSEDNIVGKAVAVWMHKEPGLSLPSFSDNRFINP